MLWKCSHVFTQMKDTQSHRSAINRFVIECVKEIMLYSLLSGRCLYSSLFRFNQTFNGETEIAGNSDRLVWSIKPTVGFSIEFEKPVRNAFFKSFLHQGFCNFAHLIYVTSSYSFLNCIGFMRSVVSNKIWNMSSSVLPNH